MQRKRDEEEEEKEDGSDRYQQHYGNLSVSEVLIEGKNFLGLNDAESKRSRVAPSRNICWCVCPGCSKGG